MADRVVELIQAFVVIRPDAGPFHFNDSATREEADQMAAALNGIVEKWLPWNQMAFGPFATVELRDPLAKGERLSDYE